jgi:hypothetical protein
VYFWVDGDKPQNYHNALVVTFLHMRGLILLREIEFSHLYHLSSFIHFVALLPFLPFAVFLSHLLALLSSVPLTFSPPLFYTTQNMPLKENSDNKATFYLFIFFSKSDSRARNNTNSRSYIFFSVIT